MTSTADRLLSKIRTLTGPYGTSDLSDFVRDLDTLLSAGGTPPEEWREGPDAHADVDLGPVGPNGECWGWQGSDSTPPPPEGLAVFAHWSRMHNGINVEMDVPNDLRLTVMVNEWRAVDTTIGQDYNDGVALPPSA